MDVTFLCACTYVEVLAICDLAARFEVSNTADYIDIYPYVYRAALAPPTGCRNITEPRRKEERKK